MTEAEKWAEVSRLNAEAARLWGEAAELWHKAYVGLIQNGQDIKSHAELSRVDVN